MADPSNSNLAVRLRCRLCGGFFLKLNEFIQHKRQWHLAEFQRTNTHCIVLEEVAEIPTDNQEFTDDFFMDDPATQVNNSAKIFQVSISDPLVSTDNTTTTGYKQEIVELFTFDESVEYDEDWDQWDHDHTYAAPGPSKTSVKSRPGDYLNNVKNEQLANDTDIGGVLIVELFSEPSNLYQDVHDLNNAKFTPGSNEDAARAPPHEIHVTNEEGSDDLLDHVASNIKDQPIVVVAETNKAETSKPKLQNTTKNGSFSFSHDFFTVGLPQVRIKRLNLKQIKNAIHPKHFNKPTQTMSSAQKATSSSMLKENLRSSNGAPRSLYTNLNPLFKCSHPGCSKTFNRKRSLSKHSPTHFEDLDRAVFVCDTCKAVFWYLKNLRRHQASSSCCVPNGQKPQKQAPPPAPDKPFKCKIGKCSARFRHKRSVGRHERSHMQLK